MSASEWTAGGSGGRERREARAKRGSGDADAASPYVRTRQQVPDTLARTSALHAPRIFESPGSDMPGRSIASARIFASARRWPTVSQSSFGRPSIGTSTTADAGRCEGSKTNAIDRPPVFRTERDTAARGERGRCNQANQQDRGPEGSAPHVPGPRRAALSDRKDIEKFADALRETDKQRVADERMAD